MLHLFSKDHSIFNRYIAELRDKEIQKDSLRFRRNLERVGEIFAYEISKTMPYKSVEVNTPLGVASTMVPSEKPVLATILRAGLPLHQGMLNVFDDADNAFISAYRKHHKDGTFNIQVEYMSSPDLSGRTVVLCDPMLATGASIVLCYKEMLRNGTPKHTHIVSVLASAEGLDYAKKHLPGNVSLWIGAIDEELTAQSYIVPGLGDAGDLAYGEKK